MTAAEYTLASSLRRLLSMPPKRRHRIADLLESEIHDFAKGHGSEHHADKLYLLDLQAIADLLRSVR